MMRCHWTTDRELGRIHIPGCMGAAIYGPGQCTCRAQDRRKAVEEKLTELERRIAKLEARDDHAIRHR